MQRFPEAMSERFVACSKGIVLECDRCAEKLILLGPESDW
jgi:hypothetical protein